MIPEQAKQRIVQELESLDRHDAKRILREIANDYERKQRGREDGVIDEEEVQPEKPR